MISGAILAPFWEGLEAWGRQKCAKSAKKEGRKKGEKSKGTKTGFMWKRGQPTTRGPIVLCPRGRIKDGVNPTL